MNKRQLVNALVPIIHAALSGDPELAAAERASYFFFKDTGGLTLSQAEATKLREASALISRFFPNVGNRTCDQELKRFCCQFLPEIKKGVQPISISMALPELLDRLQSFSEDSTTVYVEVCGLDLRLPEWTFGPARFMKGDHLEIEADHSQIVTLDGRKPDSLKANQLVAQIKVQGEAEYAADTVVNRVIEVLDVIQFLSLPENPYSWESNGLCFGFYCCEPIPPISSSVWSLTSRGPTWLSTKGVPPVVVTIPNLRFVVNDKTDSIFAERAGGQLSSLLVEQAPSAFDQNLLTAISWVANAIRERNLARKYLSFYVAAEALVGRDKLEWKANDGFQKPILPIHEGVAFILGRSVDDRRGLSSQMIDLAKTRNKIVHRGYTEIDETDLRLLGHGIWSCCWQTASKREQFRHDDSFRDWLLNRKFGNADE